MPVWHELPGAVGPCPMSCAACKMHKDAQQADFRRMEYAVYKAHVVSCNRACSGARRTAASWLWPTSSPGGLSARRRGAAGPRRRQKLPSGACGGPFWASTGSPGTPSGLKITSSPGAAASGQRARRAAASDSEPESEVAPRSRDEAPAQLRASSRDPATEPEMPSGCPRPLSGSQGACHGRRAREISVGSSGVHGGAGPESSGIRL